MNNTYFCKFEGRERHALGISAVFKKTVQALNAKAAQLKLYDTHEHIHKYLIVNMSDSTDIITHKQIKV